jgi:hypothetical protein
MIKWFKSLFVTAEDVAIPAQKLSDIVPKAVTPPKIEKIVEVEVKSVKATKASLSKLTKQGLEDFAKTNYKVDIDKRKKKADLVAEVLKLAKNAK